MMNSKLLVLPLCFVMFFIVGLNNAHSFPSTEKEFAQLPPYCKARYSGRKSQEWKSWESKLGKKYFLHFHHYCSALNSLNNYWTLNNKNKKRLALMDVINNTQYVIDRTPPTYFLRPQFHIKRGKGFALLNQLSEAIKEYNIAIKLKPNYSSAYVALSDIFKKSGDVEQALKILDRGLKKSPGSKLLLRRKRLLMPDGD